DVFGVTDFYISVTTPPPTESAEVSACNLPEPTRSFSQSSKKVLFFGMFTPVGVPRKSPRKPAAETTSAPASAAAATPAAPRTSSGFGGFRPAKPAAATAPAPVNTSVVSDEISEDDLPSFMRDDLPA